MKTTIQSNNDPFRKYWWVLLAGFALTGAWICLPLLEEGSFSGRVSSEEGGLRFASQPGLDPASNPNGAPGGVLDLSMESSRGKASSGAAPAASSLYQALEGGAPGAPVTQPVAGADPAATLAAALKQVSEKTDPSGWGGRKAQKGFNPPKAQFGSLSGLGAPSGGGGSSARVGAFGAPVAQTGIVSARGLSGSVSETLPADVKGRGLASLKASAASAKAAAGLGTADGASSAAGRFFDGSSGGGAISGGGQSQGEGGGLYASLNAAPANLKANRTDLDHFEIKPLPPKPVEKLNNNEEMKKQLLMVAVSMAVMGVAGPMAGMIVMQAIPMMSMMGGQKNTGAPLGARG